VIKNFLFFLLLINTLVFGGFQSALKQNAFTPEEEAFKYSSHVDDKSVIFQVDMTKDVHLYKENLKITLSKPIQLDITNKIILPKPVIIEGEEVFVNKLFVEIPKEVLSSLTSGEIELNVEYQGCSDRGLCYNPQKKSLIVVLPSVKPELVETEITSVQLPVNEIDTIVSNLKNNGFLIGLFSFFVFGLLLALTPCVFPMIPILSSLIVNANQNKKLTVWSGLSLSLTYVVSMGVAYAIVGVVAGLFGANLQMLLQNTWVITVFAAVFVLLAFSMFGYFEIGLPSFIQTFLDKKLQGKENGGYVGIALMGFLSALIVGPCVAPPLAGALVYIGQTGDVLFGGLALFVLSIGMGVPLLLIGMGAGKIMPKPGMWMTFITKFFGVIMLVLAIWISSRVIAPEWIVLLSSLLVLGVATYLTQLSKHLLIRMVSVFLFVYGSILMFGYFAGGKNILNPLGQLTQFQPTTSNLTDELFFQKVHNVSELKSLLKANIGKKILVDYWASWCVNCKELDRVISNPEVKTRLKDYVLFKVDLSESSQENNDLMRYHGVVGAPTILFYNEEGNIQPQKQIVGVKTIGEFLTILE
jgi:thiol:disulfide interchange protein DsbD